MSECSIGIDDSCTILVLANVLPQDTPQLLKPLCRAARFPESRLAPRLGLERIADAYDEVNMLKLGR
jgi:hypothetical protein